MNPALPTYQHAELFIDSNGQILAHNITPEIAAILSELNPNDVAMAERAKNRSSVPDDSSKNQTKLKSR